MKVRHATQVLSLALVVFPSEGCRRVTGRAGASSLTFIIEVLDCRRECVVA